MTRGSTRRYFVQSDAAAPRLPEFPSRREFLQISASVGFLGGLGSIGSLGRALAAQADVGPNLVRLSADIEPIVRVIEDTPREKIFEAAAELLRSEVDYRQFMASLYLAGIRNVDSRSSGSRFNCVYVINSAHLLALESPRMSGSFPEDMFIVSPSWRPHMLAASMLHLPAPSAPESQIIQRTREAVAGL